MRKCIYCNKRLLWAQSTPMGRTRFPHDSHVKCWKKSMEDLKIK